jgi:hypothetical protein
MQTFFRDLARGEQIEYNILYLIQKKYPKAYKIKGYCKDYDLFIPEIQAGIEVKSDEKSKYTGNIVVEIEFNGKPSALSTTKADYWVWYDGECVTFFKPKDIRNCIDENNLSVCSFVGKGDVKEKKAYLVKKNMLYKYAITKKNIKWD